MSRHDPTLIILTPGFPASEDDSNCLPLQQQLIRQIRTTMPRLHIIIISFQYPYFRKPYTWNGIPVICYGGKNKGGLSRLLLRRKIFQTLERIHSTRSIAGILSFWYGECAWVGKKFADAKGLRHRCWLLGQDARKENKYPGRLAPGGNEILALSDFLQHEFEKNHAVRPLHKLYPGIDPSLYSTHPPDKDIDLLGVGSLVPLKQYGIFIRIVEALRKDLPHIRAAIAGDGIEKQKLQQEIERLQLTNNLRLLGEIPHHRVQQYMQRARILLHPSSFEGFGVVCIEALAAGAEVISFVQPLQQSVPGWHIAGTEKDMLFKSRQILSGAHTFNGHIFNTTEHMTRELLQQFDIEPILSGERELPSAIAAIPGQIHP